MLPVGVKSNADMRAVQQWKPNFNLFTFEGCWATYEGQSVNGYLHGAINPCDTAGPGWDCSYCSVDFQCEGNLPAPN